ncbi:MAG: hypothetical protein IM638_11455 [Bacteroidetes bacterium]|nr:hypothetical protein [Bacteroidota bacterium]
MKHKNQRLQQNLNNMLFNRSIFSAIFIIIICCAFKSDSHDNKLKSIKTTGYIVVYVQLNNTENQVDYKLPNYTTKIYFQKNLEKSLSIMNYLSLIKNQIYVEHVSGYPSPDSVFYNEVYSMYHLRSNSDYSNQTKEWLKKRGYPNNQYLVSSEEDLTTLFSNEIDTTVKKTNQTSFSILYRVSIDGLFLSGKDFLNPKRSTIYPNYSGSIFCVKKSIKINYLFSAPNFWK